jgi:3-hydroxyisobutyrate dehydrogenase
MTKIAWIGTGVMGKPMALHLAKAGYTVNAYNRTFEKAQALEPMVHACETIQECVHDADLIVSIVGYPNDVKDVYEEVFLHAKKGAILIDMTTSSPTLAIELAEKANRLGFTMMDAPVTGGDLGAINATLSIMVGGDESVFQSVLPILSLLGKTITYMGNNGSGQHAKLANQIVIAGNIAGIAESLVYAESKGLNKTDMLKVITGGSAQSWQAQINGAKMIEHDYRPGFYIKHFLKDLRLAIDEKGYLPLEVLEKVEKIYSKLANDNYSELGTQAIIEYYLMKMA